MDAAYNDIQKWDYKALPATFGAELGSYKTHVVKTMQDVKKLLEDKEFADAPVLQVSYLPGNVVNFALTLDQFVELYMPREDAPVALKMTAEASARNNAKQ